MRPSTLCRCFASKRQRGAVVVEFAVTATLVTTIVFGASEYGRAMYQYDTVVKNVRAATRYLSQFNAGDSTSIGQAKCLAVYGSTTCGQTPLVPGLTTSMVSVCDASSCSATNASVGAPSGCTAAACLTHVNLVTVKIAGLPFTSLATGFVRNFTMGTVAATMPQGF